MHSNDFTGLMMSQNKHADLCPICSQPNMCTLTTPSGKLDSCWCKELNFTQKTLGSLPPDAERSQCICQLCATSDKSGKLSISSKNQFKLEIERCAAKAIDALVNNIHDDALYLLFEWKPQTHRLSIVVTDATKTVDSPILASVSFSLDFNLVENPEDTASDESSKRETRTSENVKYWLHDYLTTASDFFRYSLVAIFHSSSRANTELL
jgi:hypothetical protein